MGLAPEGRVSYPFKRFEIHISMKPVAAQIADVADADAAVETQVDKTFQKRAFRLDAEGAPKIGKQILFHDFSPLTVNKGKGADCTGDIEHLIGDGFQFQIPAADFDGFGLCFNPDAGVAVFQNSFIILDGHFAAAQDLDGYGAVSYTHLDVYKRQEEWYRR